LRAAASILPTGEVPNAFTDFSVGEPRNQRKMSAHALNFLEKSLFGADDWT
jgi:hypothetical protein